MAKTMAGIQLEALADYQRAQKNTA